MGSNVCLSFPVLEMDAKHWFDFTAGLLPLFLSLQQVPCASRPVGPPVMQGQLGGLPAVTRSAVLSPLPVALP